MKDRTDRELLRLLARRDVACPGCGYAMRGLPTTVCPECGRKLNWIDVKTPEVGLAWRVAVVDLAGLIATIAVNVLLVVVMAVAVVVYLKGSWFTADLWNLGRGPKSISGLLLIVIAVSLMAWGWAWERSSMGSYRAQWCGAVWCWVLTAFHAVGVVSVLQ
jgi:hypothetical protein